MSALWEFVNYVKLTGAADPVPSAAGSSGNAGPAAMSSPSAAPVPHSPANAVVVGLRITPQTATLLMGGEQPFSVAGEFSDGSFKDVTDKVEWSSTPPHIVDVDRKGVATGLPGDYRTISVTITATVDARVATSVTITVRAGDHPELLKKDEPQDVCVKRVDDACITLEKHDDRVTMVDLTPMGSDLQSTEAAVESALAAEKAMKDAASRATIDLDKPQAALACMKNVLPELQKGGQDLEKAREPVAKTLGEMMTTVEQLQSASDNLRRGPEQLPDHFFKELDDSLGDTRTTLEHVWDFINGMSAVTDWVGAVKAVIGSDVVKDSIKGDDDAKFKDLNEKVQGVGETLNALIAALHEKTQEEMETLNVALERQRHALAEETATYLAEAKNFGKLVAGLSAKSGCPKGVSETYLAVVNAGQVFRNALSALITKNLSGQKFADHVQQFLPPGKLIWNAPSGDTSVVSLLVYEKNGKQYGYHATIASLKKLLQQLQRVKQVYDAADAVQNRVEKWSAVH